MSRHLSGHKVNPANDKLDIEVQDTPGAGGACHAYVITGFDLAKNPSKTYPPTENTRGVSIIFQNGPIGEAGVNGITHEALLAILIDRLEDFQAGPFFNAYNAMTLEHLKEAQASLLARTKDRMTRGVEGTHAK